MKKDSEAFIDDPNKPRHGVKVKILDIIDEYNYSVEINGKTKEINYSYLVKKEPIMIGNIVTLDENHWERKAIKGEAVKVLAIEWNEHLASRSYCARWTYKLETLNGEKFYMDDYQVTKI